MNKREKKSDLPQESVVARLKRRRKKERIRMIAGAAVIVLLLVLVVFGIIRLSKDGFKGTWNLDGTTMYQFNGSGKGEMVLPNNSYDFSYSLDKENKTISIDFVHEKANDYTYTFEFSGDKLILSGGDEDETFAYEFTKVK